MKKILGLLIFSMMLLCAGVLYAEEHIITPGERLQIFVVGHEDISSKLDDESAFMVMPDGMMAFPLIGKINTKGMSVADLTNYITAKLSEFIVKPDVVINVVKLGTTRVFVLG